MKQYLSFIADKFSYCENCGCLKIDSSTDKHSEVEVNNNPNKKLPTYQQQNIQGDSTVWLSTEK